MNSTTKPHHHQLVSARGDRAHDRLHLLGPDRRQRDQPGPVVGLLMLSTSWRVAFLLTGLAGLLWVLVWHLLVTDLPQQNRRVGQDEIALVTASRAVPVVPQSDLALPLRRTCCAPARSRSGSACSPSTTRSTYSSPGCRAISPARCTWTSSRCPSSPPIPWACGFVGYVGGGIVADALYRRSSNRLRTRKLTTIVPLALAAAALLAVNAAHSAGRRGGADRSRGHAAHQLGAVMLGDDPRAVPETGSVR